MIERSTRVIVAGIVALLIPASAWGWEIPQRVRTDLVRFMTEDGIQLNGALYRPDPQVNRNPKRAILVTHGTGGSFYGSITGFLPPLLAEKGYLGLSMNRRDHGHGYYRSTFEDGLQDLKAGVDFLVAQGAEEVFLMGHSLGTTFVPYYMAMTDDVHVKLVGLSGAIADLRQATVETHLGSRDKYQEVVQLAKMRFDQGRGDEMFLITLFGTTEALSYHTFLNYRGPDTNAVPVKWIPQIKRSMLLLHNSTDKLAREEWQEALQQAGGDRMDYVEVEDPDSSHTPGQGHSYFEVEEKTAQLVAEWLQRKDFLPQ
jgi:dipeptidyl aminopeptidase/acylaminoacyl peptidase